MRTKVKKFLFCSSLLGLTGCATLFGWSVHAPARLSNQFYEQVETKNQRLALYLPKSVIQHVSKERGGRFADPQTYYVGEALSLMILEAFQHSFNEFVFMETPPTPQILQYYGIPYLVGLKVKQLGNQVTLKGQRLELATEVYIFDSNLDLKSHFDITGASDAQKIFAKKGGPELNLNAALEKNITSTVLSIQDWLNMEQRVSE